MCVSIYLCVCVCVCHQAVPPSVAPGTALDESSVAVHTRAMDALDDVVTAFMKIKDVQGCHEAAR